MSLGASVARAWRRTAAVGWRALRMLAVERDTTIKALAASARSVDGRILIAFSMTRDLMVQAPARKGAASLYG
jgi:hypothetical protein